MMKIYGLVLLLLLGLLASCARDSEVLSPGDLVSIRDAEIAAPVEVQLMQGAPQVPGDLVLRWKKRIDNQLWYARGVGLVRESFCCPAVTEELFSYQVVASESQTLGDVKERYAP